MASHNTKFDSLRNQIASLTASVTLQRNALDELKQSVTRLRKVVMPPSAVDQDIVDSKIRGVYSQIDATSASQSAKDKEFADSMYKLRDSVQKSFDAVKSDMGKLLKQQQSLVVRMAEQESQIAILKATVQVLDRRSQTTSDDQALVGKILTAVKEAVRTGQPQDVIAAKPSAVRFPCGISHCDLCYPELSGEEE